MATTEGPFATIESAHEFLALLGEQIDEALTEARLELSACGEARYQRRAEAWQLVIFTTTKLLSHVDSSRRLMNDLRTLRNLLHRTVASAAGEPADAVQPTPAGTIGACATAGR